MDEKLIIDRSQDEKISDLNEQLEAISLELSEVKIELAERRPVSEMIRYLTFFLGGVGLLVGLFGFRQVSDIRTSLSAQLKTQVTNEIEETLEKRYNEETGKYADFRDYIISASSAKAELDKNFQTYSDQLSTLENYLSVAKQATDDNDIAGEFSRIRQEFEFRKANGVNFSSDTPYKDTIHDPVWRKSIDIRVTALTSNQDQLDSVSTDEIFNFVQTLRGMGATDAMRKLTERLPEDPGKPANMALKLAIETSVKTGSARDESYESLLNMLHELDERSPAIVVAEAWNATEGLRRYTEMIEALQESLNNRSNTKLPEISYPYAILAELYLRRGFAGDVEPAQTALLKAKKIASLESIHNQWTRRTIDRIGSLESLLTQQKLLASALQSD